MPRRGVAVGALVFVLAVAALLALISINSAPAAATAWTATNETCYGQCITYRWYWHNSLCYDMLMRMCVIDEEDLLKEIGKAIFSLARGSAIGIGKVPTAFFCANWINTCIVPEQNECRGYCNFPGNEKLYAADLNVGHAWSGSVSLHGVHYSQERKTIYLQVHNTGMAQAIDIKVRVETGHTSSRDRKITSWTTIYQSEIAALAPKTASINKLQTPYRWAYEIPQWEPVAGEFNAIRIRVDPLNETPEQSEGNNEFVYELDLLPMPSALRIESIETLQNEENLGQQWLTVKVKNTGEEAGAGYLRLFNGTSSAGAALEEKRCALGEDESCVLTHDFFFLGADGSPCGKSHPFTIQLTQDSADATVLGEQKIWLDVFSGTIYGSVVDQAGLPYEGATASAQGITATTDKDGRYRLTGLQQTGDVEVVIGAPGVDRTVKKTVRLGYNKEDWRGCMDSLIAYLNETVLESTPGSVTLSCSQSGVGELDYFLSSSRRGYAGVISDGGSIEGVLPGKYNLTIIKRGVWAEEYPVLVSAGEEISLDAACSPRAIPAPATRGNLGPQRTLFTATIEGVLYDAAITQDGTRVYLLTGRAGQLDTAEISAWTLAGKNLWRKKLNGPKVLESHSRLTTTFDGKRVLYCYEGTEDSQALLLDGKGDLVASKSMGKRSAPLCYIAPYGEFIVAGVDLHDAGLNVVEGKDVTGWVTGPEGNFIADILKSDGALSPNLVVGQAGYDVPDCKGVLCEMTFNKTVVHRFAASKPGSELVSYSADRQSVAFAQAENVARYTITGTGVNDAAQDWAITAPSFIKWLSMSPSGDYLAMGFAHGTATPVVVRAADGQDITPEQKLHGTLRAVRATDRGLISVSGGGGKADVSVFGSLVNEERPGKDAGKLGEATVPEESSEAAAAGQGGTPSAQSWWDSLVGWFAGLFGFGTD